MLNGSRKVTRVIGSLVANREKKNANREIKLQRAVDSLQNAEMRIKLHHVMVRVIQGLSPQTSACTFVASELAWLASAP